MFLLGARALLGAAPYVLTNGKGCARYRTGDYVKLVLQNAVIHFPSYKSLARATQDIPERHRTYIILVVLDFPYKDRPGAFQQEEML